MEEIQTKKSNKKVFIIAGVIVAVAIIALVAAFYLLGRPKTVLLQGVTKLSTEASEFLELGDKDLIKKLSEEDVVSLSGNLTLGTKSLMGADFGFNYSYVENKKTQNSAIELDLVSGKESLIGANFISTKDSMYLKLKKVMDIYYSMPNGFVSVFENSDTTSYRKVIKIVADSLKKEINDKDLKTDKKEITIDGKKISAKTVSYSITTKSIYNILNESYNSIKSDKELLKDLATLSSMSEKEFQTQMESVLKEMKADVTDEAVLNYTVYYTGFNKVVMHSLNSEIADLQYYDNGDVNNFRFISGGETVLNLLVKKDKNKYDVTLDMEDVKVTGTIEETKEEQYKYDLKLNAAGSSINLNGTFVSKTEKDVYKTDFTLSLEMQGITIPLSFNTEIKFSGNVDSTVVKNSKPLSEMTEEEQTEIMTKILQDPVLGPILQLFLSSGQDSYQ